jgi:acyl-CoA synthetase (AMP-forming)/AMP-acid ligase II
MNNESLTESPAPFSTVTELLRYRAARTPDRLAYEFLTDGEPEGPRLTYGELDRRARAVAAALQSSVAAGERVLLVYPPGLEFLTAFFGCLYGGAVAVPAYPPRPGRQGQGWERLLAIVRNSCPSAALSNAVITPASERTPELPPELRRLRWVDTDGLDFGMSDEWRAPKLGGDSLAFLQYTSGSTTEPKGVMISHANLLHNEQIIKMAFRHTERSVVVGWLPLYHDMGLIGNVLQPLYVGVPSILMSPLLFLQRPYKWLQAITHHRATTSGAPNFAYDLCARKVTAEQRDALDLSSWDLAFCGAEPIRPETLERFTETFGPCGFRRESFYPCYGLAEATLFVTGGEKEQQPRVYDVDADALERNRLAPAAREDSARRLVGCGRGWLDQRIVIVDAETRTACPPGRVGEIWLAGASITRGYWGLEEETARTFNAYLSDTGEGPFLRTGDLGVLEDGELFVTGRLKDLLIIAGTNHYPQDIEATVEMSHPLIRPGCSAAFTVERKGQERLVVLAEVEQRLAARARRAAESEAGAVGALPPGREELVRTLTRAVGERHGLRLHEVLLLNMGGVKKTSSGKVRRHACREAFLAGRLEVWEGQDGRA